MSRHRRARVIPEKDRGARPSAARVRGERGEEVALRYLQGLGWRILAHGWRVRGGEVDLIAACGETIVFVEVKARSGGGPDDGRGAVDTFKRRRLVRAATAFLAARGLTERPCRFDVVLVRLGPGGETIQHLPGAFDGGPG